MSLKSFYCNLLTVNAVVICLVFVVATFSVAAVETDNNNDCNNNNSNNKIFLTSKNYNEITSNKTAVLIKWAAPWCSHSQDLAPVWDKLVASYGGRTSSSSAEVLLAEVDCGTDAEAEWCTSMGYTAFPTLTYGEPSMKGLFLQQYQSLDKSYQTLLRFVQDELEDVEFCTPGNLPACPTDTRTKLDSFWNMTIESLEESIKIENDEIQRLHNEFDVLDRGLKQKYNMIARQHHGLKADIKRRTKLFRNILKTKKKKNVDAA
mmetsp:Transcript_6286/g.15862  ORF Transcript_6286/g.15862 Transcript_6286/m.15862 type:complete len:262 (-) Transcript_6286:153-938(-)